MATLHVHLQEGFVGEPVVVTVGDTVLLDEPDVRTRMQAGFARLLECAVPDRPVTVRVELSGRGQVAETQVDPTRTPWLAVSAIDDGAPVFETSREMLGYL